MDSDGTGEGDVRGIINRLEHLKELGVTGAWLNPIFLSPMRGLCDQSKVTNCEENCFYRWRL